MIFRILTFWMSWCCNVDVDSHLSLGVRSEMNVNMGTKLIEMVPHFAL